MPESQSIVLSNIFKVSKGTRQGDPLLPLLLTLCMELLAEYTGAQEEMKGIHIAGEDHTLVMYADDVMIYLFEPEQSTEDIIEEYGNISGNRLSERKSEITLMGCTVSNVIIDKYAFHWDVERIKYLGIHTTRNLEELYNNNFAELINQRRSKKMVDHPILPLGKN